MTRISIAGLTGGLLAACAGTALALPPIMDRVPAGQAMVIIVPKPEQLEKDFNQLGTLVGQAPEDQISLKKLMAEFPAADHIDPKGAFAIVVPSAPTKGADGEMSEPKGVVLFSSTSYDDLVKKLGGTPTTGTDAVKHDGEDLFVKKLDGGLVAASDDRATLESVSFASGNMSKHREALGARASSLSDEADVVILMPDLTKFHPLIDEGMTEMRSNIEAMGAMGGGQQMNPEAITWMMDNVVKQATAGALLFNVSEKGVGFDFVSAFKRDSRPAQMASSKGDSGALMKRVPAGPYLLAGAFDYANPAIKQMFADMPKGGGADANVKAVQTRLMAEKSSGMAWVVGVNKAGPMNGLLNSTVIYTRTDDPAGYINTYKTETVKAYQTDKLGTMTLKDAAVDVQGKKVDQYDIVLEMQEGVPPQAMQMMFGMGGGPSGYMSPVEKGVVMTMGKSSELMGAAINAAGGQNTLASDKPLSSVADNLPKDRVAEMYLGTKGILDTALPFIAMMTGPVRVDVPADVPPIAMAVTPSEGSWQFSLFVPSRTIKVGADIGKAFEEAKKRQEQDEEEDMEPGDKGAPSSKPKF